VEQHHAFNPGFSKLEEYVNALREKREAYDGAKVLKLIDDFGSILATHLTDEIETFVELQSNDKIDWKRWNKRVSDLAVKSAETV
jgi:hypothetical protein